MLFGKRKKRAYRKEGRRKKRSNAVSEPIDEILNRKAKRESTHRKKKKKDADLTRKEKGKGNNKNYQKEEK